MVALTGLCLELLKQILMLKNMAIQDLCNQLMWSLADIKENAITDKTLVLMDEETLITMKIPT